LFSRAEVILRYQGKTRDYGELLNEWAKQFHVEVRLDVEDDYIRKYVKYIVQSGNAFLWIDKEPVCMTFRERPHENGISIGYVFTPPKFRNKGYALHPYYRFNYISYHRIVCNMKLEKSYASLRPNARLCLIKVKNYE